MNAATQLPEAIKALDEAYARAVAQIEQHRASALREVHRLYDGILGQARAEYEVAAAAQRSQVLPLH